MIAVCSYLGGFATATIGFGGVVIMMLVFPLIFPFLEAAALANSIILLALWVLAWQYRRSILWAKLWLPLACYLGTSTAVISVLSKVDTSGLKVYFGIFLALLGAYQLFFSRKPCLNGGALSAVICSSLAGGLSGLFGIGGPLMAVYMMAISNDDKDAYIGTTQIFFSIGGTFSTAVRFAAGIMTARLIPFAVAGTVGMMIGQWTGTRVIERIPIQTIRKCVYIFLIFSGVTTVIGCL